MANLQWIKGIEPSTLTPQHCQQVLDLFLNETGEVYSPASVRHLPIPQWGGNLILVNLEENEPRTIQGVLWATPFKDDIVRIAAFVIAADHQNNGLGGQAWEVFSKAALEGGYRQVQLEVKADNKDAQRFYQRRFLEIKVPLEGYYQSGLGYMMRGPLRID